MAGLQEDTLLELAVLVELDTFPMALLPQHKLFRMCLRASVLSFFLGRKFASTASIHAPERSGISQSARYRIRRKER